MWRRVDKSHAYLLTIRREAQQRYATSKLLRIAGQVRDTFTLSSSQGVCILWIPFDSIFHPFLDDLRLVGRQHLQRDKRSAACLLYHYLRLNLIALLSSCFF
jgi:hypothetical protein